MSEYIEYGDSGSSTTTSKSSGTPWWQVASNLADSLGGLAENISPFFNQPTQQQPPAGWYPPYPYPQPYPPQPQPQPQPTEPPTGGGGSGRPPLPPPKKSNVGKIVLFSVLGVAVLGTTIFLVTRKKK